MDEYGVIIPLNDITDVSARRDQAANVPGLANASPDAKQVIIFYKGRVGGKDRHTLHVIYIYRTVHCPGLSSV